MNGGEREGRGRVVAEGRRGGGGGREGGWQVGKRERRRGREWEG